MSKSVSMWVPGHAVTGQDPAINARIVRAGDGAIFREQVPGPGFEEWFQFPIPTPTREEGYKPPTLVRVMVLFSSDEKFGPLVTRVDAWHGNQMVRQGKDISLAGPKYADQLYEGENIFDVNFAGVNWGIGISVRVRGLGAGGEFHFVSAGADFHYEDLPKIGIE